MRHVEQKCAITFSKCSDLTNFALQTWVFLRKQNLFYLLH